MSQEPLPRAVQAQLENIEAARVYFPDGEEPDFQTAYNHYNTRRFGWDLHIIARAMSRLGSKEIVNRSAHTIRMQLKGLQPNGFLPNMQYFENDKTWHFWRLEQKTFNNPGHSDYEQPPYLAMAIDETCRAYERLGEPELAQQFRDEVYERGVSIYGYYENHQRSGPDNPLVFEKHPHGTGRDSDPSLKPKIPRNVQVAGRNVLRLLQPVIDPVDVAFDNIWTISQNLRLKHAGWDLEKAKKIYGRRDVMKNCVVVTNSLKMAELSRQMAAAHPDEAERYQADAAHLEEYALGLERRVLSDMWFPDEVWSPKTRSHRGAFYTLGKNGEPVKQMSIGNLMVVTLPNLTAEQLESTLNLIMTSFGTKFGLPSLPKDSKYYDPHHKRRSRLWGGGAWPHMNVLIADGLRMQAARPEFREQAEMRQTLYLCEVVADMLVGIGQELTKDVFAEFYDPETGEPQRYPHVRNFGMAMLAGSEPYQGLLEARNRDNYFNLCQKLGRTVSLNSFEFERLAQSA